MPKIAAAAAFDFAGTPNPNFYREGATAVPSGIVVNDSTPRFVLSLGTLIGERWRLRLPLLYDIQEGEEGVFASALNCAAHGYGKDEPQALESLLDAMVDTLDSLNDTPDDQLDRSAVRLRELLLSQLAPR